MSAKPQANVSFLPERVSAQTQPQRLVVHQHEFRHDVAVVSMRNEGDAKTKYQSGQPVAIWWGWGLQSADWFYGYVNHTQPSQVQGKVGILDVFCAGAVWPTRLVAQRVFTDKNSDVIAAQVASEHRLSCLVDTDAYVLPMMAQHNTSDWDLLVRLAKRRGYTLYARNTDLRYLRRIVTPSARVPLFTKYPNSRDVARGAIVSFTREMGEAVPGQGVKATRVQHVVTDDGDVQTVRVDPPQSGLAGSSVSDPLFSIVEADHPVHTVAEATANLSGVAESNRFFIGASARLRGDVRVHQGMTIRVVGVSDDDDGYWWVTSARHTVDLTDYATDVTLARDSVGQPVSSPDVVNTRSIILGRPAVIDASSLPSTRSVKAPPTVYDPSGSTPSVVPVADQAQQVANLATRPVTLPVSTSITTAGVTKIDPARLHAWRAQSVSVRRAS